MSKRARENDVCGHKDAPHFGKGMFAPCFKANYYKENRETIRERGREYVEAHRAEASARSRAWYKAHPEWARETNREGTARRMAADPEKERARVRLAARKRKGVLNPTGERGAGKPCAICMQILQEGRGRQASCLDHDHITGQMRGWLCNDCNKALGCFKDSPAILRKAAEYLEQHQSPKTVESPASAGGLAFLRDLRV